MSKYTIDGLTYNDKFPHSRVENILNKMFKKMSGGTVFEVLFDSNGGSEVDYQEVKKGEKVTEPEDPILDGATFSNWYNKSDISVYDFDTSVNSDLELLAAYSTSESISTAISQDLYNLSVKLITNLSDGTITETTINSSSSITGVQSTPNTIDQLTCSTSVSWYVNDILIGNGKTCRFKAPSSLSAFTIGDADTSNKLYLTSLSGFVPGDFNIV